MNSKPLGLLFALGLLLAPASQAMAASYFLRLKDANGNTAQGVVGGFAYNRAAQVGTQGACANGGAVSGPSMSVPANALGGTHPAFSFASGSLDALICRTQSFKPVSGQNVPAGTRQCLDNGTHMAGVTQSLVDVKNPEGPFTITFTTSLAGNGCGSDNEPAYSRRYAITGPNNFLLEGEYWVVNQVHANPEPGSLALLLAGLAGFGVLWWTRARRPSAAS